MSTTKVSQIDRFLTGGISKADLLKRKVHPTTASAIRGGRLAPTALQIGRLAERISDRGERVSPLELFDRVAAIVDATVKAERAILVTKLNGKKT